MTARPAAAGRGHRAGAAADLLRRDVRLVTTLLGDAIRANGSEELFERVERLREASIALHEHPSDARLPAVERRTRRLLAVVTGHERLLAGRPGLANAIALRAPYVDALSVLQLRALDDPQGQRVAQATIAGSPRGSRTPAEGS